MRVKGVYKKKRGTLKTSTRLTASFTNYVAYKEKSTIEKGTRI